MTQEQRNWVNEMRRKMNDLVVNHGYSEKEASKRIQEEIRRHEHMVEEVNLYSQYY